MALVGDKKLFRAVIVISQKISFFQEGILADDIPKKLSSMYAYKS